MLSFIAETMRKETLSERALRWLRGQFVPRELPLSAVVRRVAEEQFGLSGLHFVIDEAEVDWQSSEFDNDVPFAAALSAMIDHFLHGTDSSTSVRDVASLRGLVDVADAEATRHTLRALLDEGSLYLFSPDFINRIERGELPFHRPDHTRRVSEYWTFGLLLPALRPWEFIGFVNRRQAADTYHTGYQAE